jgi:hypothetical protein
MSRPDVAIWRRYTARVPIAGGIAERRATRGRGLVGSHADWVNAANHASVIAGSVAEVRAHLRYLEIQTRTLVDREWPWIQGLADVLVERRTLTGDQLRSAMSAITRVTVLAELGLTPR